MTEDVLFVMSGSDVVELTEAVLVMLPGMWVRATIVTVAVAPAASTPRAHETAGPAEHVP